MPHICTVLVGIFTSAKLPKFCFFLSFTKAFSCAAQNIPEAISYFFDGFSLFEHWTEQQKSNTSIPLRNSYRSGCKSFNVTQMQASSRRPIAFEKASFFLCPFQLKVSGWHVIKAFLSAVGHISSNNWEHTIVVDSLKRHSNRRAEYAPWKTCRSHKESFKIQAIFMN